MRLILVKCLLLVVVLVFVNECVAGGRIDSLMFAAKYDRVNKMKKLLAKGADVNARNETGSTVLMQAAVSIVRREMIIWS